jgi:hypothetical protein
MDAATD